MLKLPRTLAIRLASLPAAAAPRARRGAAVTGIERLEQRVLLSGSLPAAADNSLAYDAQGNQHIAYYDTASHNLKYTVQSPDGVWSAPSTIDGSSTDVGRQVTLAIGPSGQVGVAYFDVAASRLKFATLVNNSWQITIIDPKGAAEFPSLVYNAQGSPVIVYYRPGQRDLRCAMQLSTGSHPWKLTTLARRTGPNNALTINPVTNAPAVAFQTMTGQVMFRNGQRNGLLAPPIVIDRTKQPTSTLSLTFGPQNLPVVTYYNATSGALRVAASDTRGKIVSSSTVALVSNTDPHATVLYDSAHTQLDLVYYDAAADALYVSQSRSPAGPFSSSQLQAGGGSAAHAVLVPGSGAIAYTATDMNGASDMTVGTVAVNSGTGAVITDPAALPAPGAAPTGVAALPLSSTAVQITWADNSDNETGFLVERSADGTTFTAVTTTVPNAITFTDTTAQPGVTYYYRVSAVASDNSLLIGTPGRVSASTPDRSALPAASAAPTQVTATATSSSMIQLSWGDNSDNETGFRIDRSLDATNFTTVAVMGANSTTYTDTGLSPAATYTYRVSAVAPDGTVVAGSPGAVTASPLPETFLGMTIPGPHQRLWWTPQRLQQARQWYAAHPFTPAATDPMNNALAYVITGNTAYAQNAITSLMNFTISQTELSGVASDNYRWSDWVPLVFDWCYDQMTPTQRQTFMARYDSYASTIESKSWGGPSMPASNYFWGYLRNELNWGLATYYEDPNAKGFLTDAIVTRYQHGFLPWAASHGAGGVPTEGSQYGRYMLQYVTTPLASAALLGLDLNAQTNFYKEAVYNLIYSTTPGPSTNGSGATPYYQTMPYGDDEQSYGFPKAADSYYGDFMTQMAQEYAGTATGAYARQWLNLTGAGALADNYVKAADPGGTAQNFSSLPLDYYAPGPSYFYTKNGWSGSATQVDFQLGTPTGGSHTHLDAGAFQIWSAGAWVSKTSTGYSGSIAGYGGSGTAGPASTVASNGIIMGGLGLATADPVGAAQVTRLQSAPLYSFASVDLTQAYHSKDSIAQYGFRDNPYAGGVVRDYLYIKPLNALVSLDRLTTAAYGTTTAEQAEKAFLLHFPNNPVINGQTVTGVNGNEQLTLTALTPQSQSPPVMRVVNEVQGIASPDSSTDYQYRLEEVTSGSAQSYLVNVMQATPAGVQGLSASMTEDATSFTITLQDPTRGTAVIVFQKGMTSSGGSIGYSPDPTLTPAASNPLGAGVEAVSVGDQGPVWQA